MADICALEHSTLKVPYEVLNKNFRLAQKNIDRESSHVLAIGAELEKLLRNEPVKVTDVAGTVRALVEKMNALRQRFTVALEDERKSADALKRRIAYLRTGTECGSKAGDHGSMRPSSFRNVKEAPTLHQWRRERVDRLIVDYLLRAGLYETAEHLAKTLDAGAFMCNEEVFLSAKEVEESLENRDLDRCLEWAYNNRSKLRRMNSRLELSVRLQQFVQLIKQGKRSEAVQYARKWFSGVKDEQWAGELRRAMGLLAVGPNTCLRQYADLLSDDRWLHLLRDFRDENLRLYQLGDQSAFSACFQCGLSALKTPHCTPIGQDDDAKRDMDQSMDDESFGKSTARGASSHRRHCPICSPDVYRLSANLPYAHASQSRLVCAFSGEPLNENNPPMMLPNGMVYGQNSLSCLQKRGVITCPRTKEEFPADKAVRVYVM